MNIAIIEDDLLQRTALQNWLEDAGHNCDSFDRGIEFTKKAKRGNYQTLLFDWKLPDMSGVELLVWLRTQLKDETPVIFITTRDSEEDIVLALSKGANDYLVKPARKQELLARIEVQTRRLPNQADVDSHHFNNILIDTKRREITLNGNKINLTLKEFTLACYLLNNIGKLLSRSELLNKVWGHRRHLHTRTLDTHISRLRKKPHLSRECGWQLSAVYQSGYQLDRIC